MQTVYAYIVRNPRYAPGWRHLDVSEFVGTVKVTPARYTRYPEDYDDGGVYVRHARAPASVNIKELILALEDTMSGSGCQHEYDCCGCATYRTTVKHVGNRRLVIRTSVYYNY